MFLPAFRTALPLVIDNRLFGDMGLAPLSSLILDAAGRPDLQTRIQEDGNALKALRHHVSNAWGLASPLPEPFRFQDENGRIMVTVQFRAPTVRPDEPEDALPFLRVMELDAEENASLVRRCFDGHIGNLFFLDHNGNRAAEAAVRALAPDPSDRESLLLFFRRHWCAGFQSLEIPRSSRINLKGEAYTEGYPPLHRHYPGNRERLLHVFKEKNVYDADATRAARLAVFTLLGAPEEIDRGVDGNLPR